MKLTCSKCGGLNRIGMLGGEALARCQHCSALLDTGDSPGTKRPAVRWGWLVMCLAVVTLGLMGFTRWMESQVSQRAVQLENERRLEQAAVGPAQARHPQTPATSPASSATATGIAPEVLSGVAASTLRDAEWRIRLQRDPSLARSPTETNLLRMKALSTDPSLTAWQSLFEVATAALPKGSRVEVLPDGDGFAVRVAFRMSALSEGERGITTRHRNAASMRREARELSARVIRDVFDFCGARGIRRLSVACNRAVKQALIPEEATEEEKKHLVSQAPFKMQAIYRLTIAAAQARSVADWAVLSTARVLDLVSVESDGLSSIRIENLLPGENPGTEPDGELEL